VRDQALIVGVGEMTEHLGLRTFRAPKALGEGVSIAREPFGDVARCGSHDLAQPIGVLVVAPEFRRQEKQIDSQVQLVRELPGGDFGHVREGIHAAASSNRIAGTVFEKSGRIGETATRVVAGFAMPRSNGHRNICVVQTATVW
jgi:hypothetical protein